MRVAQITTAFSNGEISPQAYMRVDIQQRARCAATLTNFLVRPYGNIQNVSGTRYTEQVKTPTEDSRLIPFIYSTTQAYALEFGDQYIRFFTDYGMVYDGSTIYELSTDYTEDEIYDIKYAQRGDLLYMVHPNHPPAILTRSAATSWSIDDIEFVKSPFADQNSTSTTLTCSAATGSITVTASSAVFEAGHVGTTWQIIDGTTTGTFKITAFTSSTQVTATVVDTVPTAATDQWSEAAWSSVRGYPETINFHQNRMLLCCTEKDPQRGWASDIGVYDSFDIESTEDDTGFDFDLPSNEYNKILWTLSGENFTIGTSGSEFILTGGTNNSTLTPANRSVKKQTAYGSENGVALSFGSYQYFIQRTGRKLMEFAYKWEENQYSSGDMTILSDHITESGIKEFALRKNQDAIMFCVLNNGKIAAFTRETTQNVVAWSRLETDGLFKSVCCLPRATGNDDVVVIVERTINGSTTKYIEYFEQYIDEDQTMACFLDCSLSYDGYALTEGITLTSTDTTGDVTLTSSASYFTSSQVGRNLKIVDSTHNVIGKAKITGYVSATEVTATIIREFADTSIDGGTWAVGVVTISGLDHLEGEDVSCLLDGSYNETTYTVTSGSITLPRDYCYVTIGLLKESTLKTMPLYEGSQAGTAVGKYSRSPYIAINMYKTLGITAGDDENQYEVIERNATTPMGEAEPLVTDIERLPTGNEWEKQSQVTIKQPKPYPCNILGLVQFTDTEEL
jgi:hypothetical protein